MAGVKISDLPVATTLEDSALFEAVINGRNSKITAAQLMAELARLMLRDPVMFRAGLVETVATVQDATVRPLLGSLHVLTPTANTTLTFATIETPGGVASFSLEVRNGGTPRTLMWPSSVRWPDGVVPSPCAAIDVYSFYTNNSGATWRGALVASYLS
ncbi:hypothetical protein OL229_21585 [Neisseriaceae bacterium JH1-16]|nr:hypothetical protein [Neisseriaceae bacterium JH1-16]